MMAPRDLQLLAAVLNKGPTLFSLHTLSPLESRLRQLEAKTECSYPGYRPVLLPEDGNDWASTGVEVMNIERILFPMCSGPTEQIISHAALAVADLHFFITLFKPLKLEYRLTPSFAPGAVKL